MLPTDLTVAAVVQRDDRFLLVEEYASGRRVLTQPGGHIESGESPEQAVIRETEEEAACQIECRDLIGVYLWIHPQTRQQFLRIVYAASFLGCKTEQQLDKGIVGRRWLSLDDIGRREAQLRNPSVLRCVQDYVTGTRQSDALLTDLMPLQNNVDRILATANLI